MHGINAFILEQFFIVGINLSVGSSEILFRLFGAFGNNVAESDHLGLIL